MAAKEIYDYVSEATADHDQTLSLAARGDVVEHGSKNVVIHLGDDESEQRVSLGSGGSIFYLTYPWSSLNESDAGTVVDFFHDASKGNGRASSFKLSHTDGHTYVVRFDTELDRTVKLGNIHSAAVRFKVLGRIADA